MSPESISEQSRYEHFLSKDFHFTGEWTVSPFSLDLKSWQLLLGKGCLDRHGRTCCLPAGPWRNPGKSSSSCDGTGAALPASRGPAAFLWCSLLCKNMQFILPVPNHTSDYSVAVSYSPPPPPPPPLLLRTYPQGRLYLPICCLYIFICEVRWCFLTYVVFQRTLTAVTPDSGYSGPMLQGQSISRDSIMYYNYSDNGIL